MSDSKTKSEELKDNMESSIPDGIKELEVNDVETISQNGAAKQPALDRHEITNAGEIQMFINVSLNAQRIGVLDGAVAFNKLVGMLNNNIKPLV